MPKKKLSFDEALNRLEEIISVIEANEASLEDSIKLYKEGMQLSLHCSQSLQEMEQEVLVLQKNADGSFSTGKLEFEPAGTNV